ncbi:MAG: hypothetical protein WAK51_15435 [Opitutaceae bacterium]
MSAKTGRPKSSEIEKRHVFAIRISQKERVLYESAAEKDDLGIQAWIRNALTKKANETLSITESGAAGIVLK